MVTSFENKCRYCHIHNYLNTKNGSTVTLIWEGNSGTYIVYIYFRQQNIEITCHKIKTAMYLKAVLKYFDVAKKILHVVFLLVKTIVFAHIFKQTIHLIVHIVQYSKLAFSITYKTVAPSRKMQFW